MKSGDAARPRRAPIVMLTDFGRDSFYVGAMKAAVIAADPRAAIVDLTHGVRPFAVEEASFILSLVFDLWPERTVFLAVVDPGVGGERLDIVVESAGRFIVGPDNGVASDAAARFGIDAVFAITEEGVSTARKHRPAGRTFLGRDVFSPVAAFLARGGDPARIGRRIEGCDRLAIPEIEAREGYVRGWERYVDDFGNVLTNISGEHISRAFPDTVLDNLRVDVNNSITINGVVDRFSRGGVGELVAVLDSWNLVELSVNQGRAVDLIAAPRPIVVELRRD